MPIMDVVAAACVAGLHIVGLFLRYQILSGLPVIDGSLVRGLELLFQQPLANGVFIVLRRQTIVEVLVIEAELKT